MSAKQPLDEQSRARAKGLAAPVLTVSAALAGLLGVTAMAVGQPAEFYRGKSVEILVGFSAGGGYDAYARALARTIGNHIPGNPQVVVKNFTGAGSLRLARYLQDVAPRDGLAFGTIDNGLMVASLMNPSAGFEAPKLSWVGSIAKELQICMTWHASRFRSIDDMRQAEAVFGATGRDDIRYTSTNVLRRVSGAKIKIVTGYPGTTDIRLALERGELDGVCEVLVEHQGDQARVAGTEEDQHHCPVLVPGASGAAGCAADRQLRRLTDAVRRAAADLLARRNRPPVRRPAGDSAGPSRRSAPGLRRDHEGPRFCGIHDQSKARHRPLDRRTDRKLPGAGPWIATGRY